MFIIHWGTLSGASGRRLYARGKLIAVDISEEMARRTRERAEREGVEDKVESIVASASLGARYKFVGATFDHVATVSIVGERFLLDSARLLCSLA